MCKKLRSSLLNKKIMNVNCDTVSDQKHGAELMTNFIHHLSPKPYKVHTISISTHGCINYYRCRVRDVQDTGTAFGADPIQDHSHHTFARPGFSDECSRDFYLS